MALFLMCVHIFVTLLMAVVILIQKSEGGGLGMGSGMGGLISARGSANFLSRLTSFLAGLFFLLTLAQAFVFKGSIGKSSLFHEEKTPSHKEAAKSPGETPKKDDTPQKKTS